MGRGGIKTPKSNSKWKERPGKLFSSRESKSGGSITHLRRRDKKVSTGIVLGV